MEHDTDKNPKKSASTGEAIDLAEASSTFGNSTTREAARTEELLKNFKTEVASSPGFRAGSARAPGHYISAVEVTSWLQVPAILNQLQNESIEKIRVVFPTPTPGSFVAPEHAAGFIEEQHQIANFMKENHAKPIEELRKLLTEKIENSLSFGILKSRPAVGDSITASAWVDASLRSSEDSRSLSVSTLFPIGQKSIAKETTTNPLTLSLLESAVNDRPSTVTIPGTNPQRLEELAHLFHSLLEDGGRLHNHYDTLASNTKVWVGPHAPKINTSVAARTPCPEVKEYSLTDFIVTFLPKDRDASSMTEAQSPPDVTPVFIPNGSPLLSLAPASTSPEGPLSQSHFDLTEQSDTFHQISPPEELILQAKPSPRAESHDSNPLEGLSPPPKPNAIEAEIVAGDLEERRRRRRGRLSEPEVVETPEHKRENREPRPSDGGLA